RPRLADEGTEEVVQRPQRAGEPPLSSERLSRSTNHSATALPPGNLLQGLVGLRLAVQQGQEEVAVAVGERRRRLLAEADLVLGDDRGLTDAQLGVADLLDEDGG